MGVNDLLARCARWLDRSPPAMGSGSRPESVQGFCVVASEDHRLRLVIAMRLVGFRRGHDGLGATVRDTRPGADAHSGLTLVVRSKRDDGVEVLAWDGTGLDGSASASMRAASPGPPCGTMRSSRAWAGGGSRPAAAGAGCGELDRAGRAPSRAGRGPHGRAAGAVGQAARGRDPGAHPRPRARADGHRPPVGDAARRPAVPWGGIDPPGVVLRHAPGRGRARALATLAGFEGVLASGRPWRPRPSGRHPADGRHTPAAGLPLASGRGPAAGSPARRARAPGRIARDRGGAHAHRRAARRGGRGPGPVARGAPRGSGRHAPSAAKRPPLPPPSGLEASLREQAARQPRQSQMGKATADPLSPRWNGLTRLLDDGRLEPDTGPVERQIRPLAPGRKSALFEGHEVGARSRARIASPIGTARMGGVEPFASLRAILEAIAAGRPPRAASTRSPLGLPRERTQDRRTGGPRTGGP